MPRRGDRSFSRSHVSCFPERKLQLLPRGFERRTRNACVKHGPFQASTANWVGFILMCCPKDLSVPQRVGHTRPELTEETCVTSAGLAGRFSVISQSTSVLMFKATSVYTQQTSWNKIPPDKLTAVELFQK
jgi:hypothetical protein